MKREIKLLFLLLFISALIPYLLQASNTGQPSRAIHIVFDDSASMIRSGSPVVYNDRWGQAKYAMEVFAAMLEENDIMRVYYMSDYLPGLVPGGNLNAPPKLTIRGSEPATARVARIHNTVTHASWTPFDPVIRAFNDLKTADADEKWLVVLTDGAFNYLRGVRNDLFYREVNSRLLEFANTSADNLKIYLLAMGDDEDLERFVSTVTHNPRIGYYFAHARDTKEILRRITDICNTIFRRNVLRFRREDRQEFNFDIHMNELLVFAQGPEVRINSINAVRGDGSFNPVGIVNVRFSERPAINPAFVNNPNVVVSRELRGAVATFKDIPVGRYTLDVTGAEIIEIYYKPEAQLAIKLFRGGREVRGNELSPGRYQVRFGIVNDRGRFFESELLQEVTYEASVRNGENEFRITNGERVRLQPGELSIEVNAQFLNISISDSMNDRRVMTFLESLIRWLNKYWWLLVIIGLILLYWIMWGRKKRFHKSMSKTPKITKRKGSTRTEDFGTFRKIGSSRWLPFFPERGIIIVTVGKDTPELHVEATGKGGMKLLNASDFIIQNLQGITSFTINNTRITNDNAENFQMSNVDTIRTVYTQQNVQVSEECTLTNNNN